MSNIREIAKKAGVGIATVSRYLNNTGYVSDEVKARIQKAIAESNYKPNALARAIFTKNSKTIGLLVPNISNPFFNQMALVIEEYANQMGYTVFLCNTNDNADQERDYLDVLQSHRVAGILVARSQCKEEYRALDIPVLSFESHISDHIITVTADNYRGGRLAFEHLYNNGCRNILHVKGPSIFEATEERCRGFLEAAKEKGLKVDLIQFDTDFHAQMLEAHLSQLEQIDQYDGIFVFNDIAAATVHRYLKKRGIRIPDEVQLIGFDNSFIGEFLHPTLTTINQPVEQIGKKSIELLIQLIQGERVTLEDRYMETRLIQRETTRELPG